MIRKNELRYILLILVAVCFLATGGIFVKLSKLPPIATGFYRVIFSIPILFPFIYKDLRTRRIDKKDVSRILIAGFFLAGDLILWNISFGLTSVANANLLANLVPFTIIPFSYFVFKEKISKEFFLAALITIIGVVVLIKGKANPTPNNFMGDLLAFCTSIFYAGFLLTVYRARDRVGGQTIMFISAFGSSIVLLIAMIVIEGFHYPKTIKELLPLLYLAIFSQILGQGFLSIALGKVKASLSSILVLLQPAIAGLYSFLIFKERLGILEIIGMMITIIGVYAAKRTQTNA